MNAHVISRRGMHYRALTVAALILMAVAYASPIWWVSLAAPQYSHEAFPDGIRIHFHFDGVYNGCKQPERAELDVRGEELDCKSEMDTINHYVGMYPIAAGAPIERALSPFLVSILGVVMIAFMVPGRKAQVAVMAVGGAAVIAWASLALFTPGGIHYFTPGFVRDLAKTMSLEPADYAQWSGMEAIRQSYEEGLGRYFRQAGVIEQATAAMMTATRVVYALMAASVVALTLGLILLRAGPWLLGLVPVILPVAFVADYASWLYWFGHNLNDMGAFTVKAFMPTVFGQGKVAQFSTYSYPHYGYALLLAMAALMLLAALIRRKQLAA
jgi:hypothetical protein